jgi:hypothetical protein
MTQKLNDYKLDACIILKKYASSPGFKNLILATKK